ncbi:GABA permease [Burkholderia sp. Ac-20353]|uniref:GABA permease n=1 Tax=Burkholderia sp. Ac-20353 TaxID=2703894 RepID=UPI00197BE1AF|nr:GABA permease [Burkholderia sp. Ac-20353]MBN3787770.1 GABA permease [Burkholderia sp. Ac-20353]
MLQRRFDDSHGKTTLAPGLKQRHVTMLSIAGVIGAGLFVGSGHAIAAAGPAALVAYLLAGTLVVLVMRMLGEMAVASPDTGSFSTYADRAIGKWAGFTIGWLYWWFWVLAIPLEAIAAAAILHAWMPAVPTWGFALAVTALLTATNLFSVARYGEFEFWFALLKVLAIIAFIVVGAIAMTGALPGRHVSGVSTLMAAHGGFMPNGYGSVLGALLTTMFSFMGTEIVTIAAAESKNPARQITRATNSVIWRIGLFYIVSIFLVISVVPWNDPMLVKVGSYRRTLELLDIPYAKLIVDFVVLVAVASCLNSAIYTSSRMVFSLARRGDAPALLRRTTEAGQVPRAAVLASTAVGFVTIVVNYFAPEKLFTFLLASSGAVALLVYLVIAVSQLLLRRRMQKNGVALEFRMWLYPWLTWAVILFILGALGVMLTLPEHRAEVLATTLLTAITIALGLFNGRRKDLPGYARANV